MLVKRGMASRMGNKNFQEGVHALFFCLKHKLTKRKYYEDNGVPKEITLLSGLSFSYRDRQSSTAKQEKSGIECDIQGVLTPAKEESD